MTKSIPFAAALHSAILGILLLSTSTNASNAEQCATPGSCDAEESNRPPCSLYLAPSAIPSAGLGLFAGRFIPAEESVHEYLSYCEEESDDVPLSESSMWYDLFVPVWNRGERPFGSWMGYVWPSSPGEFWNDADDGKYGGDEGLAFSRGDVYQAEDGRRTADNEGGKISPVSAYALGIASLANSHQSLNNIARDTSLFASLSQMENHKGLLEPSATPKPGEVVQLNAPWDAGVGAFQPTHGNDFLTVRDVKAGTELLLNYGKRWHKRRSKKYAREEAAMADSAPSIDSIVRPIEWLEENGVCLFDKTLTYAPSRIPHAGRGAFAHRSVKEGEVLAVSPMLAVARDDLKVTHSYNGGDQILLNYAFGHPDSSLLLVPMAPMVGYVNHSHDKKANAKIRWPQSTSDARRLFGNNEWLDEPVAEVLKMSSKIAVEYVALKNIWEGEEVVVDYGAGWDESWKAFARMHPYERPGYFRREAGVPEGFYPEGWLDLAGDDAE